MVQDNTTASPTDPALLLASQTNVIPFIPSARPLALLSNGMHIREADSTFAKGYKEMFTIQTNSGDPWTFRYIAFSYKGDYIVTATGTQFYSPDPNSSNGTQMTRVCGVYQPGQLVNLEEVLFQGAKGTDWTSEQVAPLDTQRVSILKDSKFIVRSGNDSGTTFRKNIYIPLNKNLRYAGDEESSSYLSTGGKPGMGDLYVIVYANLGGSASTTSRATILFNGTYYWHEK